LWNNAERQKADGANALQPETDHQDPPRQQSIAQFARREGEQHHRNKLNDANDAKRQRRVRQRIDRPADSD
jgi:hypothetical protein